MKISIDEAIFYLINNIMGKHAFMIGCYKCPDYLEEFIDSLDSPRSNFYIHVNKKNEDAFTNTRHKLMQTRKNIVFVPSIEVKWGGSSLLKSLKIMLGEALKDKNNVCFHFMTGQDALVVNIQTVFDFFDNHPDESFVHVMDTMNPAENIDVFEMDYLKYYHLFDIINVPKNLFNRCIEKGFVSIQKLIKQYRTLPYDKVYKGRGWFSINRKAAEVLFNAMNDDNELNKWNYTFATEEFFIPTILKNSDSDLNLVNKSFYYIDWEKGPGPYPSVLDMSYYDDILNSGCFFCRKIDPVYSSELLKTLKKRRGKK